MSPVATFTLPAESLPPGRVFGVRMDGETSADGETVAGETSADGGPAVDGGPPDDGGSPDDGGPPDDGRYVRLETVAVGGPDPLSLFWVGGIDPAAAEAALAADDRTERVDRFHAVEGETLFRARWDGTDDRVTALRESGAVLVEGSATPEGWTLRARFRDEDHLEAFYRDAVDRGLGFDLVDVLDPGRSTTGDYGLTPQQRVTLATAARRGFFEVPRGTTMVDLAGELGVSDSAVSQRIRRGLGTLVEEASGAEGEGDPGTAGNA